MSDGPKLLLVDGNNMAHRVYWAHKDLAHAGRHTGLVFGFLKQLISLHKEFPGHFRVVAWDRGCEARLTASRDAIRAGILPPCEEGGKSYEYKGNRDREMTPEREDIHEQMDQVKQVLSACRCLQVGIPGEEADDVIYSFAVSNRADGGESVIVSSDNDFYQVLGEGVTVYDAMKHETWTRQRFEVEMGFAPELWVDVAGLMGEPGDNIFGVPGWGPVTALKCVREHGSLESVMAAVRAKEKRSKKEETLLAHVQRAMLARDLKRMRVVQGIPRPRVLHQVSEDVIKEWCVSLGMASILKDLWRLA